MVPVPDDSNGDCCDNGSDEVGNEVPSGVCVVSYIRLREKQYGDEFDHLVDCTEAHSGSGTDRKHPERGVQERSIVTADAGCKGLPAEPRDKSDSETVDELIVFQISGNDSPAVDHSGGVG